MGKLSTKNIHFQAGNILSKTDGRNQSKIFLS